MKIILRELLLNRVAGMLKVPPAAIALFSAANRMSGLSRSTLPLELVPMNSYQLARGLMNFTTLQSLQGWVFPYWAEQQLDPTSPSFQARAHLGVWMNTTHRNWTAVGNPSCPIEPIVDVRGLVTPFPQGWSIDTWLLVDGTMFHPSRLPAANQRLVNDLPVVQTTFDVSGVRLTLTTTTRGLVLFHSAHVLCSRPRETRISIGFAVRPFNPEGVALVRDISYDSKRHAFIVNKTQHILLPAPPDRRTAGSRALGDSTSQRRVQEESAAVSSVSCEIGLANVTAWYDSVLEPNQSREISLQVPLNPHGTPSLAGSRSPVAEWESILGSGTCLHTPDPHVNALFRASTATLLQLNDGKIITPGPFTYHQFWFRDAAYMLWALDKAGHSTVSRGVIRDYTAHQERSGFFRSQQGEWDSNGQALWSVWQHIVLSGDISMAEGLWPGLRKAVEWIARTRLTRSEDSSRPWFGLLPPGLSAEHLGLVDYYYWDNFWSLAGIESFRRLSSLVGRAEDASRAAELAQRYRASILRSIGQVQERQSVRIIPAGPGRELDSGIVGSIAGWYPLQLFPASDPGMRATLEAIESRFLVDGLLYQGFVHSGLNPYLTLQLAHAWLYSGEQQKYWELSRRVFDRATATMAYPEAIHPRTGGGVMGDGHHGWAAAEVVLALRDAVAWERWEADAERPVVVLLAGVPAEWLVSEEGLTLAGAPICGGVLGLSTRRLPGGFKLQTRLQGSMSMPADRWECHVPAGFSEVLVDGDPAAVKELASGRRVVEFSPGDHSVEFITARGTVPH